MGGLQTLPTAADSPVGDQLARPSKWQAAAPATGMLLTPAQRPAAFCDMPGDRYSERASIRRALALKL